MPTYDEILRYKKIRDMFEELPPITRASILEYYSGEDFDYWFDRSVKTQGKAVFVLLYDRIGPKVEKEISRLYRNSEQ